MIPFHTVGEPRNCGPHKTKIIVADKKTTCVLNNQIVQIDLRGKFGRFSLSGYFKKQDVEYHNGHISSRGNRYSDLMDHCYQFPLLGQAAFNALLIKTARGVKELVKMFLIQKGHGLEKALDGEDTHLGMQAHSAFLNQTILKGAEYFGRELVLADGYTDLHILQCVLMKDDLRADALLNSHPSFPSLVDVVCKEGPRRFYVPWAVFRIMSVRDAQKKLCIFAYLFANGGI